LAKSEGKKGIHSGGLPEGLGRKPAENQAPPELLLKDEN
jgi:hypothetical protein